MSLFLRINEELKESMRKRDALRTSALRMLKSAIQYAGLEKGWAGEPSDAEVMTVIAKETRKREDSIERYRSGHREDLARKEEDEIAILREFLPEPLSPEEREALVRRAIRETGAKGKAQLGAVIKTALQQAGGRADGKQIRDLAERMLGAEGS
ncbi:GatB/YqeY domain-containing protein [Methylacidimicrobium sp. B4]|uniref:GatB/YqeY domain-containing protein n=1 Tax=Methylacidimicrobium sp. B4 TaxID=2796139 RepID=UPI001A900C1C|nr:GatB/YqeY domain-containing protein [Methylacidimicrobium sp. B4]QSR83923.1 GatB/YqeY domain-containing protein [Methylacidimicrobium sp. B4]